jgi:hypothetical protein
MKIKDMFPKDKWVSLPKDKVPDFKTDIFELIQTAYAGIGGHANLTNPNDINTAEGKFYEVIDVDGDNDIDAVSIDKKTEFGDKFVAMGHDGSSAAKRSVINFRVKALKHKGHYVECSGKIQEIFAAAGVPHVDNATDVEEILGKEIDWLKDGWYERNISGSKHKKMMMGIPSNI